MDLIARGDGITVDTDAIQFAVLRAYLGTSPSLGGAIPRSNRFGGTVYFPPGEYRIGLPRVGVASSTAALLRELRARSTLNPWLYVPETVELRFAPGAVLLPDDTVRFDIGQFPHQFNPATYVNPSIAIRGKINAGLQQIFGTPRTHEFSGGRVLLLGARIPEVHPEWWGASQESVQTQQSGRSSRGFSLAEVNDLALQLAIEAAWFFRRPPVNERGPRHAFPVTLSGPYLISRTIPVGTQSDQLSLPSAIHSLVLRGNRTIARSRQDTPTLLCADEFDGEAMMHVQGPYSAAIEDIHFDGRNTRAETRAATCAHLERALSSAQGLILRRCTFRGARRCLVTVGALPPPGQMGVRLSERDALGGSQDLLNLTFDHCHFDQPDSAGPSDRLALDRDGIVFRAANTLNLHFKSCTFRGTVRAMIRAYGGWVTVSDSHFFSKPLLPPSVVIPDNGVDLFIDAPFAKQPDPTIPNDSGLIELASVYVRNVVSRSFGFLSTTQRIPPNPFRPGALSFGSTSRDSVIERVDARNGTGRHPAPPAIRWSAVTDFRANLVMVGCTFNGQRVADGDHFQSGRVLVKTQLTTDATLRVISVGTITQTRESPILQERDGRIEVVSGGTQRPAWLRHMGS